MITNPVLETLRQRSTLRKFSDRPVDSEVEDAIIQAALRAPTASNMMYYSIIKIHDKDLQMTLQKNCKNQPYISKAPMMLVFCADYQRWADLFAEDGVPEKCEEVGAVFHRPNERNFLLAAIDATLAAQNAVIAAESLGLGSCYLGHIMGHVESNRELFDLPEYVYPILAVIFGYPAEGVNRIPTQRFDSRFIVHENKYHRLSRDELSEMLEKRLSFPEKNRFNAINKGQFYYLNKYAFEPSYMEGARSIKEVLKNWNGD